MTNDDRTTIISLMTRVDSLMDTMMARENLSLKDKYVALTLEEASNLLWEAYKAGGTE